MRDRHHQPPDEPQLRERLRTLASQRPRWGYRRLHVLLQRELEAENSSRINRRSIANEFIGSIAWSSWRFDGVPANA